jgi:signal transduction histidine kinase
MERTKKRSVILISLLVVVISVSYYFTFFEYAYHPEYAYYHSLFRDLWFLPLVLAGLWFGLKGALRTSLAITILYIPFVVMNWQGMSPRDFNRILEIAVFNGVAAVIGAVSGLQKAREKALRESESLAAMGTALSAIAHDMKNPLVAIGGFARLLREKEGIDDDSWRKLGFIVQGTDRLEALVKDMLDFSRPLGLTLTKQDMNEAVRDSVMTLESKARERRVGITLELAKGLPLVTLDRVRIDQVILNLVDNAIEASPEGEAVVVRTLHEGGKALFEVADRGSGIALEHRKEIFTPFFTTKKHGTGLGLAIVSTIVGAHGGEVRALQTEERGATFRVTLPLAQ